VLETFSKLYPFINERYIEIEGQPLQNEGIEIKKALETMDDAQKQEYFDALPDSVNQDNIDKVYVPLLIGESGYFKDDKIELQKIIDLGVFDGMAQTITEDSTSPVSVDTLTNVIFKYKQEARNYYGLHRVMSDWNSLVNERIPGLEQDMNFKQFIGSEAVKYIEDLMKDIAGYKVFIDGGKLLGKARRNFYRQALAFNIKVIFTQFTTVNNLSILYGVNPTKFMKNFFAQLSPKNKQLIDEMMLNNNIMYDRSFKPTLDIGEARNQGFLEGSRLNKFMDKMMLGISKTDNGINKAFYLTLLETTNPETGQLYTKEEANEILKRAILISQSSALDFTKAPILRSNSDIVRMFVKFLGEPNKLMNQVYLGKKKLEFVKKLEKNSQQIEQDVDKLEADALLELQEERVLLDELIAKEESDEFATLENDEQQAIRNDIDNQRTVVNKKQKVYDEIQKEVESLKDSIDKTIASKSKTKEQMIRSSATILTAMLYMASLGVAWGLLLKDMGDLDDREEEEELLEYIGRKMGVAMINEVAGFFPIVRDFVSLFTQGYDIDTIDEIGAINDTVLIIRNLVNDISEGKELKPLEVVRDILIYGGRVFGAPLKNIENAAVGALMLFDQKDIYYRYREITGQRTASNKELAKAIMDGDDDMITAIVETKMGSRSVSISQPVMNEMIDLARLGFNINMTGVNDSYTIDGVEYKLDAKDKNRFRAIYSQADFILQRLIPSPMYRRLSDEKKKTLITSVYNYYLRLAQQTVFGVQVLPESRTFRTLNQVYRYFLDTIVPRLMTEQMNERRESVRNRA
jgi:hypothetical protein